MCVNVNIVCYIGNTQGTLNIIAGARESGGENRPATMQLKFDWLIVRENLRCGIMVTGTTLDGPAGPRIRQGKHTDRAVLGSIRLKLLNRAVFHDPTWNYRKGGEPFLMNW